LTAVLRSLVYAAIFYPVTVVLCIAGVVASLFGRTPTLAVVLGWGGLQHTHAPGGLGI
jgi:1-acyl-sn-glycerol-3-phosphate acyltransferase